MTCSCFANFYKDLFAGTGQRELNSVLSYVEPMVTEADNICLMAPVREEEIKQVAFELGSLKAPGPDGFPGIFYHHTWEVVGPDICRVVERLFNNEEEVGLLNSTDLILILKVDAPESVNQFRPISLCNFSYKVFAKLLANRVKPILRKIITEQQRAFVPVQSLMKRHTLDGSHAVVQIVPDSWLRGISRAAKHVECQAMSGLDAVHDVDHILLDSEEGRLELRV